MNGENYSAFRYGFLSAQISRVLQEYQKTGTLDLEGKKKLAGANSLLKDIVTAQKTFAVKDEADCSEAPTYHELDAFNCALDVILANQSTFSVRNVASFINFFEKIYEMLRRLLEEQPRTDISDGDCIAKAQVFFEKLADSMLAQMSFPAENIPDPDSAHFLLT